MGRKKLWDKDAKALKVKIVSDTYNRYSLILKGRKKTIQQDLEDYILSTINK